jgi:hypothetical protein
MSLDLSTLDLKDFEAAQNLKHEFIKDLENQHRIKKLLRWSEPDSDDKKSDRIGDVYPLCNDLKIVSVSGDRRDK